MVTTLDNELDTDDEVRDDIFYNLPKSELISMLKDLNNVQRDCWFKN